MSSGATPQASTTDPPTASTDVPPASVQVSFEGAPSLPPDEAVPAPERDDGTVTVETGEDVLDDELIMENTSAFPPPVVRGPSDANMKILSKLDETLGITIEDGSELPAEVVQNVAAVLLGGKWIAEEDAMRVVIVVVLNALDPRVYTPDGGWRMGEFAALRNVFLTETSRRPKLEEVTRKLQASLARPKPPRLPRVK